MRLNQSLNHGEARGIGKPIEGLSRRVMRVGGALRTLKDMQQDTPHLAITEDRLARLDDGPFGPASADDPADNCLAIVVKHLLNKRLFGGVMQVGWRIAIKDDNSLSGDRSRHDSASRNSIHRELLLQCPDWNHFGQQKENRDG